MPFHSLTRRALLNGIVGLMGYSTLMKTAWAKASAFEFPLGKSGLRLLSDRPLNAESVPHLLDDDVTRSAHPRHPLTYLNGHKKLNKYLTPSPIPPHPSNNPHCCSFIVAWGQGKWTTLGRGKYGQLLTLRSPNYNYLLTTK